MLKVAIALAAAFIGTTVHAETRYEFSIMGLYNDIEFYAGNGFSGSFAGTDSNLDGTLQLSELSNFFVAGMHFNGPKFEEHCGSCDVPSFSKLASFSYTFGGSLKFDAYQSLTHGPWIESYSYSNTGYSYDFSPWTERHLSIGPETIITISAVPEPATYGMLLGGLGIMSLLARRRKF